MLLLGELRMNFPDQFHDPGYSHMQALLRVHPQAYEFVKNASLEESNTDLPDSAFAWPERRLYPVYAPENAVLSALYTKVAGEAVPSEVLEEIAKALSVYGANQYVQVEQTKVAAPQVPEDEYLFPDEQLYRVKTAEDVLKAEKRLLEQLTQLTPLQRATSFTRLYKRAQQLDQPLQEMRSYQYAGAVETDLAVLRDHLRARSAATKVARISETFDKLAETVERYPRKLVDRSVQIKLAQQISELDEQAGLPEMYDRKLLDPLALVFNTQQKIKLGEQMIELGNEQWPLTQLAGMPVDFYSDVLGPDIRGQLEVAPGGNANPEALATILPTLPLDLKQMLSQKLHEVLGQ